MIWTMRGGLPAVAFRWIALEQLRSWPAVGKTGVKCRDTMPSHDCSWGMKSGGRPTFCKCPMRLPKSFFDLLRASSLSSTVGGLLSCKIKASKCDFDRRRSCGCSGRGEQSREKRRPDLSSAWIARHLLVSRRRQPSRIVRRIGDGNR